MSGSSDRFQKQFITDSATWAKGNKLELILLLMALGLGAFLRLYRIPEYMTFLGDEGRDAIVVRRMLVEGHLVLSGPSTSIGDMVLGPLYYYLMAPALLLGNYSPVGPAVMVAFFGVATIFLVWRAGRDWFPAVRCIDSGQAPPLWPAQASLMPPVHLGAVAAALLYATAPTIIVYSRSSWNPNIMPFFALLSVCSIWRVWQTFETKWLIVLGITLAFVLQSHYLGILLFPTIGFFWLLALLRIRGTRGDRRRSLTINFWIHSALSLSVFSLLMSPLLIFDARHGWSNTKAIQRFFTEGQSNISVHLSTALLVTRDRLEAVIRLLLSGANEQAGKWVFIALSIGMVLAVLILLREGLGRKENAAFFIPVTWLLTGLAGLSTYQQPIFDHYYEWLFPAPFLLLGGVIQILQNHFSGRGEFGKISESLSLAAIIALLWINFLYNPLKYPPLRQLQRAETVAREIVEKAGGEKLNLAVIAERNTEDGYQYFLDHWGALFVEMDLQAPKETVAEQLFVVCELPRVECDPTRKPIAQVKKFGKSKVIGEWDVAGVTLYQLIHTQ